MHEKVRNTKATLYQVNEQQNKAFAEIIETRNINEINQDIDACQISCNKTLSISNNLEQLNKNVINSDDLINYGIDSLSNKIDSNELVPNNYAEENRKKDHVKFNSTNTEQLKNDLDEVELITSRVRDSISIDLSNTRRYSPLLYEFYRKQLELAKSIQSTYNIQCNNLFDAMTLMKTCLKDYCQTVHNPGKLIKIFDLLIYINSLLFYIEYLAIDTINEKSIINNFTNYQDKFTFNDYINKQNLIGNNLLSANSFNISNDDTNTNKYIQLSSSVSFSQNAQLNINNGYSKKFLISNNNDSFCYNQPYLNASNKNLDSNYSINNTLITKISSENNSSTSTSNTSASSISLPLSFQNNNKCDSLMKTIAIIDNKQTYV